MRRARARVLCEEALFIYKKVTTLDCRINNFLGQST